MIEEPVSTLFQLSHYYTAFVLLLNLILVGCAARAAQSASRTDQGTPPVPISQAENSNSIHAIRPKSIQRGDLVTINYTASLENGQVFYTTLAQIDKDPNRPKVPWYEKSKYFVPEEVIAGQTGFIPGLSEGIVGLPTGKNVITIPSERAFGPSNPREMVQLPTVKKMPGIVHMSAEEYGQTFKSFPAIGQEVDLVPYFKARVTDLTENQATLEFLARDGELIEDSFGSTRIHTAETAEIAGKEITLTLTPKIGVPFEIKGRKGKIVSCDGSSFTVDFNHPLAGKTIVIELESVSLTKASELANLHIPWLQDHDQGLSEARKEGKPVVLVLYASWCTWSSRLREEVLEDPRIKGLKDRFTWIKINSDAHQEYKDFYEQQGFPLIVLLNPEGEIVKKLDGFRDAAKLWKELNEFLRTFSVTDSVTELKKS